MQFPSSKAVLFVKQHIKNVKKVDMCSMLSNASYLFLS